MPDLPAAMIAVIEAFAPLFSRRIFAYVKLLLVGAILAPGQRTVTAVLRVMGKSAEAHFQNYYRVLNRALWLSLEESHRLLRLLLDAFVPAGPAIIGIDETIERRRGERISAKGLYRDPVRSSHAHFVKASGLRWGCLMALARIPRVDRVWALPFLTVLAPSERYYQIQGRQSHDASSVWALLNRHAGSGPPDRRSACSRSHDRLVSETTANLLRCDCLSPTLLVAC
jgi:hypothetical protein